MKIKSCLTGATIFGLVGGILRIAQYILSIDERGFYKEGLLPLLLNIALIAFLALGTLWIIICGNAGAKKETAFTALFEKGGHAYFWLLGLLAFADGIYRLLFGTDSLDRPVAILGIAAGIIWILLERLSMKGKTIGLFAALPILHLGGMILEYFWSTYKYIHVSEYILNTLALCALLLFALALVKPAGNGITTRQRLCSTAGLSIIFCCTVLIPFFPFALLRGVQFFDCVLFFYGIIYLLLAIHSLKQLSKLPKEEELPPISTPDLSEMDAYLSDLPEVEE